MGAAVEQKIDPEPGSWQWDAPATRMLELEREEAEKTGVSGALKALEVIKSRDSGGNPRKETLELTGGGDVVVAPAISTAAAPVDVGNRELKEAAGAVAVQVIADICRCINPPPGTALSMDPARATDEAVRLVDHEGSACT